MLPSDHSLIEDHTNQNNSVRSDLQSLYDLRELLPQRPPVSAVDNYTIRSEEERSQPDQSWQSTDNNQAKELMLKVIAQTHEILKLKEQLYYYKTEFFRVTELYNALRENHTKQSCKQQQLKDSIRDLQKRVQAEIKSNDNFKALLIAKDKQLQDLKQQNIKIKAASFQIDLGAQRNLKEEVQQQARIIMELMIKNQKILKINAFLKEELTIAEGKLVRLEEQAQDKTCGLLLNNLERLKENRNIINHKESISISNWQSESQKRRLTGPIETFDPFQRQETIKLASNREFSRQCQQRPRKESKTIEKQRMGQGLPYQDKLRPLQDPKPYRKGYLGELSKKYQRRKES